MTSEGRDEREPRRVGEGLDAVARRLGAPGAASMGAVFTRWEEAVGPLIAAHARPVSLTDGVLVLAVDDPAWATQLSFMTNDLVEKVTALAGEGVVGRVDVRVRGSRG